jgi:3-hydroxyisobutyrate dehydrogenase
MTAEDVTPRAETVAVLGAGGTMGKAMGRNLARAGFAVRAWNRTPDAAQDLAGDGATICASPAAAADGATVVLTMLSDAEAVLAVMEGTTAPGTVWLQMSTIGLDGIAACGELAERAGLVLVDAPVMGTKAPAEAGELVVIAAGPSDVRARVQPLFDAVGRRTVWTGEAGTASRVKVVMNAWLVTVVEGAAETLALAEGLGVDPTQVLDLLAGGALDLPYMQSKGAAMIRRDFEPSFRLELAAKDAGLAEEAAAAAGLDLPLIRAIRARMAEGARRHPDDDMSATFLTSAPPG